MNGLPSARRATDRVFVTSSCDDTRDDRASDVLRRLPGTFWRSLPLVVITTSASGMTAWGVVWALKIGWLSAAIIGCLVIGPLAAGVIQRLHHELSPHGHQPRYPLWSQIRRAIATCVLPALTLSAVVAGLDAWAQTGQSWMLVCVALATAALLIATLGVIVALPLAVIRTEPGLPSVWAVSLFAVTRNPVAPIGTLAFGALVAWAALSFTLLAIVLVPAATLTLAYVASLTSLDHIGVALDRYSTAHGAITASECPPTEGTHHAHGR